MKLIWTFLIFVFAAQAPAIMANHGDEPKKTSATVIKPRLGDRYFIKSVLTFVYGAEATPYVRQYIMSNGQNFGGPCDEYEQVRKKNVELVDVETACPGKKSGSRLSQIPNESVVRLGYLFRTCDVLGEDKVTLNNAVKKVGKINVRPKAADYFNVIKLFNSTAQTTANDSAVYEEISSQDSYIKLPAEKQWQLLFGVTCKSTDWQLL